MTPSPTITSFPEEKARVPHIPDLLRCPTTSLNSTRLSFKERRIRGLVKRSEQEIRGISLVFREMWGSSALSLPLRNL